MSFSVENAEVFQFPYQADEQFPAPTHLPYRRIESQPKGERERGGALIPRRSDKPYLRFVRSFVPPAPSVSSFRVRSLAHSVLQENNCLTFWHRFV